MPTILCVMPHPDDESFGPAGTIAKYAAQGVAVDLIVFTRGQVGVRPDPFETPEQLGRAREYETRAAAKVLGVRDLTFLDYMDGQLDQAGRGELAGHVARAIERSEADVVIGFGPLGISRHPDHIAVHHAAVGGVERATRPVRFYYVAVAAGWADEFELEGPEAEPTHHIDISDYFQTKLTALACHFSQQDAREFFMMLSKVGQNEEWYHQVVPPYEGEGVATDLFA